jgi:hypothetical protein
MAMIEKYDAAAEPGAKGALLRGEGLYDSHISYWRKARDSGALKSSSAAVPAVAHKGRPGLDAENERLRKRLAKAEVKLGLPGWLFARLAHSERGAMTASTSGLSGPGKCAVPAAGVCLSNWYGRIR